MADVILIVDDEDGVRQTFREWLEEADLGCEVLAARDAAEALRIANDRPIDLAILDWNLGAGNDGLQLLEDLYVFHPDVVAIMITGYAHQATPLDAMRMGVRDYLDKNQDLRRETFLAAVRKQLAKLRPAKRERLLQRALVRFRDSVANVLPLVETAGTLNDPVPWTAGVRALFKFLLRTTQASTGVLLVRSYDAARQPAEVWRAYDVDGERLQVPLVQFAQSLAGAVAGLQEAALLPNLRQQGLQPGVELHPFEKEREHLLAMPLVLGPGLTVFLELFDKNQGGTCPFTEEDRRLVSAAMPLGAELLRHALAARQGQETLAGAIQAALEASHQVSATLQQPEPDSGLPAPVRDQLEAGLRRSPLNVIDPEQSLRLAELIRAIATRHGREAVDHVLHLLSTVDKMLEQ